jgi:uncharacterized iron-regulated membrane protein
MVRRLLLAWHRTFGIVAAIWLLLLAASGSIIVFQDEIDRWLNADLFAATAGPAASIDLLVSAAEAERPGHFASFVELPNEHRTTVVVWLDPVVGATDSTAAWQIYVDPATARVLGSRDFNAIGLGRRDLANFLNRFHQSLHLGPVMVWFLGLVSFAWLVDHLLSVGLAFPKLRGWAASFGVRRRARGYKRIFDVHRALALWLLPITFVLAFSGVYFNWRTEFVTVVGALSPLTERADLNRPARQEPLYNRPLSFADVHRSLKSHAVDAIAYNPYKALYWARLFDDRDLIDEGHRWIFIDAQSGAIVSDRHSSSGSAGDMLVALQYPVHSGKILGWPGRVAVFSAGIAVCVLVVSGLMQTWMKLKTRQRRPYGHASQR